MPILLSNLVVRPKGAAKNVLGVKEVSVDSNLDSRDKPSRF